MRLSSELINLCQSKLINLVITVEASDVYSAALDNVNKVVDPENFAVVMKFNENNLRIIIMKYNISIEDFVFMEYKHQHLLIALCKRHGMIDFDSTTSFSFQINSWTFFIEANTNSFKFAFEEHFLKPNGV